MFLIILGDILAPSDIVIDLRLFGLGIIVDTYYLISGIWRPLFRSEMRESLTI